MTINDAGVFSNDGSFILGNASYQQLVGFVNDIDSGTVVIEGATDSAYLKTGSQYFNLTINRTNGVSSLPAALLIKGDLDCNMGTFILTNSATIHGNVVLNGGTLSVPADSSISIKGNWSSISGSSFAAGTSTVNFIGTNQLISGYNTFYNFTKNISSSSTLSFDSASIQTIQGTLNLNGTAGNLMNLRSSATGTQWKIYPMGTVNISYLDVKDSNNVNSYSMVASSGNIIDSGNNTNWTFDINSPEIVLDAVVLTTPDPLYPIGGTVSDTNAILNVYFSSDEISWNACEADDGIFDELTEEFTCVLHSALTDGLHTLYVRSTDTVGNATAIMDYAATTFTVDTTTPTISSVTAISTINTTTISWATNENTSSLVEYGVSSSYGQSSVEQDIATRVKEHSVLISGLTACTNYHFRVSSKDEALKQGLSLDQTFATGGCASIIATSSSSSESSSCDEDEPGEPDIISAKSSGSTSIVLEIDEASGEVDEYKLDYGTKSGEFQWSVSDIEEDDLDSFTVKELSPATTYYFRIRAKNECEDGDWSDEVSAKTDSESVSISQTQKSPEVSLAPEPVVENLISDTASDTVDEAIATFSQEEKSNNNSDDKSDAKKSKAPVDEKFGASLVEFVQDSSGIKKLKIEGFGPPNTSLTVYVYSDDPTVLKVKTDQDGSWSYVLDNNLEDGEHQVYVALTGDGGEISAKSNPLVFVKTAQAVSIVSSPAISPTEKAKDSFPILFVVISAITLLLALGIIGWRFKSQRAEEKILSA